MKFGTQWDRRLSTLSKSLGEDAPKHIDAFDFTSPVEKDDNHALHLYKHRAQRAALFEKSMRLMGDVVAREELAALEDHISQHEELYPEMEFSTWDIAKDLAVKKKAAPWTPVAGEWHKHPKLKVRHKHTAGGKPHSHAQETKKSEAPEEIVEKARYRGKGVGKRGGWDAGVPRGGRGANMGYTAGDIEVKPARRYQNHRDVHVHEVYVGGKFAGHVVRNSIEDKQYRANRSGFLGGGMTGRSYSTLEQATGAVVRHYKKYPKWRGTGGGKAGVGG